MTFEAEEVQVRVLGVGIGANLVPNILVLNLLVGNELTPSHVAGQPHHVRAPVIPRTLGAHETSDTDMIINSFVQDSRVLLWGHHHPMSYFQMGAAIKTVLFCTWYCTWYVLGMYYMSFDINQLNISESKHTTLCRKMPDNDELSREGAAEALESISDGLVEITETLSTSGRANAEALVDKGKNNDC